MINEDDAKRDIYAIELLKTGILLLDITTIRPKQGFYPYNACRSMILYQLLKVDENNYLPLNRDYKPLGISRYLPWVKYDDYAFLYIPASRVDIKSLNESLFTFDDSTFPENPRNKKRYKKVIHELFKNEICFSNAHKVDN